MLSNFLINNQPDKTEQSQVPLLKFRPSAVKGAFPRALLLLLMGGALQAAAQGKIAFVSYRDGNAEIYLMNADGTAQTRLTNNTEIDFDPTISPDGSKIAFRSTRDGNPEIYIMNVNGTGQTRLTNNTAGDLEPAFSPDGSKIVFTSTRDGNYQIYVMKADGTGQTRLTNNAAFDSEPSFSPDGSKIVFSSSRDRNYEIYIMKADGTEQTNITNNATTDLDPAFSPEGKIAFRSFRDSNFEIFVMNADGTGLTNITNNNGFDFGPAFSPDGSKIVFYTDRDGNNEIYAMKADGTGPTRLTANLTVDQMPSWGIVADTDGDGDPDFNDCAPNDAAVHHGAEEICDGKDNNCDGETDEGVGTLYYRDADGDGYGDPANNKRSCSQPEGYVTDYNDCNDGDKTVYQPQSYYADKDGDGFGDRWDIIRECTSTPPAGYVANYTDCNDDEVRYQDNDGDGYGSIVKVACEGVSNDTDCNDDDAAVHEPQTYYADMDGDSFGTPVKTTTVCTSEPLSGYVRDKTDCDDSKVLYEDNDGDGYGSTVKMACGGVANNQDCNDADKTVYPGAITCPTVPVQCYSSGTYTITALQTSKDCNVTGITYSITGATTRSGTGSNASGAFNVGTSTITWTVTHGDGTSASCQTTVKVNPQITVRIPDSKALNSGVAANTVYVGYAPASSLTLTAQASGGSGTLTYKWSNGATTPSNKVNPSANTTYTVTVTDAKSCAVTASKQVTVVNVSCSGKKVAVCHSNGAICISSADVKSHLAHGDKLGRCGATNTTMHTEATATSLEEVAVALRAYPNPSNGRFTVQLRNAKSSRADILVLDGGGKVVERRALMLNEGSQTITFALAGKSSGLYLVKVVGEDGSVQTVKVAVQR